jgi:hypothetical protein
VKRKLLLHKRFFAGLIALLLILAMVLGLAAPFIGGWY